VLVWDEIQADETKLCKIFYDDFEKTENIRNSENKVKKYRELNKLFLVSVTNGVLKVI